MATVWITYAWADDEEGDFAYLVQELEAEGVEAKYDKVALIPGRDLWDQIGNHIANGSIDGWAYLITPNSLASEACREELAYALGRALKTKGRDFSLIGLLHGVRFEDIPPALRTRLCVSLASPNWKQQIKAGLEGQALQKASPPQTHYVWQVHQPYSGSATSVAVEVRPRFGEVMYWRFAVPTSATVARWGYGPAGGGLIAGNRQQSITGLTADINGIPVNIFGAGDKLSPSISAYLVFNGTLPDFVGFGLASEPYGSVDQVEVIQLR
jgi:TIR domain